MKGYLPTYDGCIICGDRRVNPAAMHVRFYWDGEKIDTVVDTDKIYNGYEGIMHGGIITALLDEAMGWAVAVERKCYFVTGELQIRFVKPVKTNGKLRLITRCVEHLVKYSVAEGKLLDSEGKLLAKAQGKFFEIPYREALKIKKQMKFRDGDLDTLVNPEEDAKNV